jgi:hypothetical protein
MWREAKKPSAALGSAERLPKFKHVFRNIATHIGILYTNADHGHHIARRSEDFC